MRAMIMEKPGCKLKYMEIEKPHPNQNEILIKIAAFNRHYIFG